MHRCLVSFQTHQMLCITCIGHTCRCCGGVLRMKYSILLKLCSINEFSTVVFSFMQLNYYMFLKKQFGEGKAVKWTLFRVSVKSGCTAFFVAYHLKKLLIPSFILHSTVSVQKQPSIQLLCAANTCFFQVIIKITCMCVMAKFSPCTWLD